MTREAQSWGSTCPRDLPLNLGHSRASFSVLSCGLWAPAGQRLTTSLSARARCVAGTREYLKGESKQEQDLSGGH